MHRLRGRVNIAIGGVGRRGGGVDYTIEFDKFL